MKKVEKTTKAQADCPMVGFINLISGKWAIPILYRLMMEDGPVRFNRLQRAVAPITQKELTRHLKLFTQQGFAKRTVYPEMPPRVEYQITDLGKTLKPTLDSLAQWMISYGQHVNTTDDTPPES